MPFADLRFYLTVYRSPAICMYTCVQVVVIECLSLWKWVRGLVKEKKGVTVAVVVGDRQSKAVGVE